MSEPRPCALPAPLFSRSCFPPDNLSENHGSLQKPFSKHSYLEQNIRCFIGDALLRWPTLPAQDTFLRSRPTILDCEPLDIRASRVRLGAAALGAGGAPLAASRDTPYSNTPLWTFSRRKHSLWPIGVVSDLLSSCSVFCAHRGSHHTQTPTARRIHAIL